MDAYDHDDGDDNDKMTTRRRRPLSTESLKARLLLTVACIWPLMLLALLASSSSSSSSSSSVSSQEAVVASSSSLSQHNNLRLSIRNALDRVDIVGYGPTHPRVAVVVVGSDKSDLVTSVKSVIEHTDLQRIFVIAVVVDGQNNNNNNNESSSLIQKLRAMEEGSVPHWHGTRADVHNNHPDNDSNAEEEHAETEHSRKVHVIVNKEKRGLQAAREDAVDFCHLLATYHEQAGLKSPSEDLLLLLLEPGTVLHSNRWLPTATKALIVPPPLLDTAGLGHHEEDESNNMALKLANAVVFPLVGIPHGQRVSLDINLAPIESQATVEELNGSSGDSYMSPAWDGAAMALRLETYRNLPLPTATSFLYNDDAWAANLDVSLALWLCADGMDVVAEDVQVQRSQSNSIVAGAGLSPSSAARVSAAWMDDPTGAKFFKAYHTLHSEVTALDWDLWHAHADAVWRNSRPRCRSFDWYIQDINPELRTALREYSIKAEAEEKEAGAKDAEKEEQPPPSDEEPIKQNDAKPAESISAEKNDDDPEQSVAIPERREGKKPSKPLREENLNIVQQAKPVDLEFKDVSDGHHDHPHLGGKDVDGNLGYIHNATHLRMDPPTFGMAKQALVKACEKHDNNYRMLTEKVYVDLEGHEAAEKSGKPRVKIFCLVYTTEKGHNRIPRIRETWGQKCDGFMVGSTKTDPAIDAVEIPHEGPEEYNNIWQKVRSMWAYIYDNYYQEGYDWFHIGGDDLYLIVENLRLYLESEEIQTAANGGFYLPDGTETTQTPLFLGRRFAYQGDMNDIFISGGSGYTMNRAALKALVTEGLPNLFPHAHTFSEDTMIAKIFRKKFGVYPYDTQDEAGGERYMPFMPGHHYGYKLPDDPSKDWYAKYSINIKEGPDHCAAKSVAFHYVKDDAMYRLHALLYHLCPST